MYKKKKSFVLFRMRTSCLGICSSTWYIHIWFVHHWLILNYMDCSRLIFSTVFWPVIRFPAAFICSLFHYYFLSDPFLLSFLSLLKTFFLSQLSPSSARQTDADSCSSTSSRGPWLKSPTGMFQKPNETTSCKDFFISWGVLKRHILLNFLWIGWERVAAHW